MAHPSVATDDLPALPRDEGGPVFSEPWQAQAFALAVRLAETGCFSWSEWTAHLAREIRSVQERGEADLGLNYYHHWLAALERLCLAKGLVTAGDMTRRKEDWLAAYLRTPHGQPVELAAKERTP
jgi:nitrile hydratase accessory protein